MNNGKTEYLFFMMAALMAVNTFVFFFVAYSYKYREPEDAQVLAIEKVVDPEKPPAYEQLTAGFNNQGYTGYPENTKL